MHCKNFKYAVENGNLNWQEICRRMIMPGLPLGGSEPFTALRNVAWMYVRRGKRYLCKPLGVCPGWVLGALVVNMPHSICPSVFMGMLIFVAPSVDGSCKIMGADLLNRSFASCFLVLAVSLHGSSSSRCRMAALVANFRFMNATRLSISFPEAS